MQVCIQIAGASSFDGGGRPSDLVDRDGLPKAKESLLLLIAEDEAMIALELESMVQELGHEVVGIARTADEAVRLAAMHRPDLVLMDIRLARGDGIEAAIAIRARHDIPAVFMTAHSDAETRRRAMEAAPFDYLVKPIGRAEVEASLIRARSALGRRP